MKLRSKIKFIALVPVMLLTSPAYVQTQEVKATETDVHIDSLIQGMYDLNTAVDLITEARRVNNNER